MPNRILRIYFDFVDPASYIASHELAETAARATDDTLAWIGFELRPPPMPLTASTDSLWVGRKEAALARANELGLRLDPPSLVPWTRKAHELYTLAESPGQAAAMRSAIFNAFFSEGRDIGRVDVLVDIAVAQEMDRTETKAVLDVDRQEMAVREARAAAVEAGVSDVPCYSVDGRLVQGFPDLTTLGTLLPDP